jgi:hypothetical protein
MLRLLFMERINHEESKLEGKLYMIRVDEGDQKRISQGDVYKDIEYIEYAFEKDGAVEISKILFPLVVVLTQDCDLAQDSEFRTASDKTKDKVLFSVLVAPMYNADDVFNGTHLDDLYEKDNSMAPIARNKSPGKFLMQNERCRYHYLEFPGEITIVPIIIDFKHYFSININQLISCRKEHFVCRLSELYREDLSLRFANFLSRIGLP